MYQARRGGAGALYRRSFLSQGRAGQVDLVGNLRCDPVEHLVWKRRQLIDLRTEGRMFVRSSRKPTASMDMSRFDDIMTVANVPATLLRVVVPV